MHVSDESNYYILSPAVPIITDDVLSELKRLHLKYIKKNQTSSKPVVLDLTGVEGCINKFFIFLKSREVNIVNPESTMLALLCMCGFDKYVKIYDSILSLREDRQIINRNFRLI